MDDDALQEAPAKAAYEPPRIVSYGKVNELTQTGLGNTTFDAGAPGDDYTS